MNKPIDLDSIDKIRLELAKIDDSGKKARITRFLISALSSIPWVGGFMGATSSLMGEKEQSKINDLQKLWIEEHQKKSEELATTLFEIISKLESLGGEVQERMGTESYLTLIRKGFKEWDNSETQQKREYIKNLLTNACGTRLSTDNLIRLFIDWIKNYHETHFLIIKEIYQLKGISRGEIWDKYNDSRPRENSVEADLFKMLIRDLSIGGIIRQHKPTNAVGDFVKPMRKKRLGTNYKSAFDDSEPYELTELGEQFVHYTMEDLAPQIES